MTSVKLIEPTKKCRKFVLVKVSVKYIPVLIVVLLLFVNIDVQAQCAMCKAAAESSLKSNPHSIARSLNTGILYLMAVPYLLLCFIFRKQIAQLWRKFFPKTANNSGK